MRRSRPPDLLVLVDDLRIEYHGEEQWACELLLEHLQARGWTVTVVTWDRDQSVLDLEALGPVHYVEDINRWRVATWLATHGLTLLARRLRNGRIRSWWRRAGNPRSALVLGAVRPELCHYLPPEAHAGLLYGWRPAQAPQSLAATLARADSVLAVDEHAAEACQAEAPSVPVALVGDLWPRLHRDLHFSPPPATAPAAAGVAAEATLVLGIGPITWAGGADQFVAMAGRLHRRLPDRHLEFAWLGWLPDGPDLFPYRFDVDRLELSEHFHWLGERSDWYEFVQRATVFVATARRPVLPATERLPSFFEVETLVGTYERAGRYLKVPYVPPSDELEALLDAVDVPVVRFDLPAATALARGRGTAVTYPDTAALVDAVIDELDGAPATVRHQLTHLLGRARP